MDVPVHKTLPVLPLILRPKVRNFLTNQLPSNISQMFVLSCLKCLVLPKRSWNSFHFPCSHSWHFPQRAVFQTTWWQPPFWPRGNAEQGCYPYGPGITAIFLNQQGKRLGKVTLNSICFQFDSSTKTHTHWRWTLFPGSERFLLKVWGSLSSARSSNTGGVKHTQSQQCSKERTTETCALLQNGM